MAANKFSNTTSDQANNNQLSTTDSTSVNQVGLNGGDAVQTIAEIAALESQAESQQLAASNSQFASLVDLANAEQQTAAAQQQSDISQVLGLAPGNVKKALPYAVIAAVVVVVAIWKKHQ